LVLADGDQRGSPTRFLFNRRQEVIELGIFYPTSYRHQVVREVQVNRFQVAQVDIHGILHLGKSYFDTVAPARDKKGKVMGGGSCDLSFV
jgi:hypothetical protein